VKRGIVVVIVIVAIGAVLLFAAQGAEKVPVVSETQETAIKTASKKKLESFEERLANIKAKTMQKYGDNIEWLASSTTEYEEERQILRKHFAKEFDKAEATTNERVVLEIAKVDLNGDGLMDLVWRIFHRFYHGASTSATLAVSYYDENGELHHQWYFPVSWAPIAIRAGDSSSWKELIVDYRLYRWDGKSYKLIEVPVETLADEKHFKVTRDVDDRYTITIYDGAKKKIYYRRSWDRPIVTMYNDAIVRIHRVYHPGNTTNEYFDINTKRYSRSYDEVLAEKDNRIVHICGDALVIRDMFDDKGYYREVKMKQKITTLVETRRKAFLKVEWEKPDVIVVQYLAGPERRVVTEEIVLDI